MRKPPTNEDTISEATNTVISVADRSVKAITTATAALSKVVAEVVGLTNIADTLSTDIQQKESQLADLDRQLDLNTRRATAELSVRVAEAENKVLSTLLNKNGLAYIKANDLTKLREEFEIEKDNNEARVEAAVKAAESNLHASYNSKLKAQEADFKVAFAESAAKITALTERNQFLVDELAKARQDLVAERDARIKIAQAEAGRQGVVVNAGKQ